MSKSLEALELAILEFSKDLEEDTNNQWLKNVIQGLKEAKQDLERKEQLEKENQELETTLLEYKAQENLYWNTATNNVNLREENDKLKKVIEILKKYLYIYLNPNAYILETCDASIGLTKEQYELLKEVFSNDKT